MNGSSYVDRNGVNRITKQPGGACSDIFGPAIIPEHHCRQSNNTKSSIFAPPPSEDPKSAHRGAAPLEDTQNKLFGEPEALAPPTQNGGTSDGATRVVRVRQPPGGVSSKLW